MTHNIIIINNNNIVTLIRYYYLIEYEYDLIFRIVDLIHTFRC